MKQTITNIAFILLGLGGVHAQETPTATGGVATGTGGTVSYSVGQVIYTTNTGINGSTTQGVQQAYEIYTLGVNEMEMDVSLSVYPNPTTDVLYLKVDNAEGLSYQLFDLQGKLLQSNTINTATTIINTSGLAKTAYLVKVVSRENKVKTFKVIKN